MELIAETAWHHEGDFQFMENLVHDICKKTNADIVKLHITLDFDEYMDAAHPSYDLLKSWLFNKEEWTILINIIRGFNKKIMLLLNDRKAVEFGFKFDPEYVEIHSVCLNDIFLLEAFKDNLKQNTKVVLGVGGTDIREVDYAINFLEHSNIVLMFGFQNYPTIFQDVNLKKTNRIISLFEGLEYGYADHTAWDSKDNELITLLGAAGGRVSLIEKHITTNYGENRTDFSAAISIEMFNSLERKIRILEKLQGNGLLKMNSGELEYSKFGPMKKGAVLNRNVTRGDVFDKDKVSFIRTEKTSDLSQLDVIELFGTKLTKNFKSGTLIMSKMFTEGNI